VSPAAAAGNTAAVDFVIGLDPDATGSRAVAVEVDGRIVAVASAPGPFPLS
jgi:hypothetical protein